MLIPLPIFNRNQGTFDRGQINVAQTQMEMEGLERQVANKVQSAVADEASLPLPVPPRIRAERPPRRAKNLRDQEFKLYTAEQWGFSPT